MASMPLCSRGRCLCLQPLAASGGGKPQVSKKSRAKARKQAEATSSIAGRQQRAEQPQLQEPGPLEEPLATGSSQPEAQLGAADDLEADVRGAGPLQYVIWIAALLGAISVFYGLVFAASGGIAEFLSTRMTFTRKDFVPYTERRRLEAELEERERAAAVQRGTERQPLDTSPQMLYELLPSKGKS